MTGISLDPEQLPKARWPHPGYDTVQVERALQRFNELRDRHELTPGIVLSTSFDTTRGVGYATGPVGDLLDALARETGGTPNVPRDILRRLDELEQRVALLEQRVG